VFSPTDNAALHERIDALIAAVAGDPAPSRSRLERTLTDGYACALSLEAERWRLERRIGEVAADLRAGNEELKSQELVALSRRHASAGAELTHLRDRLATLRERASAVAA
jgi:hypothetical protein